MPSRKTSGAHHRYEAGDVIMSQGEKGDGAYIIEEGLVEILVEHEDGSAHSVGTRGPGTIIGEMAMVDDAPRTATVKAIEACKMLVISREDFSKRLELSDPVIQMVTQVILTRYRDMLTRIEVMKKQEKSSATEHMERDYAERVNLVESVKLSNDLKHAIEREELQMYYQPMIDFKTGEVEGFEALIRWIHPERGFVSPGLFIPIMESSGLIVEATKLALRQSCRSLKRFEDELSPAVPMKMSVNFSNQDFYSKGFVKNLTKTIAKEGVKPEAVKIEITERILMDDPEHTRKVLSECREKGLSVAIDDFGTGYSSLNYLYSFPINVLKIDQSFIRIMHDDERGRELVRSIIALGKNLTLDVIAEGVETREDAKALKEMGCDIAQGYFYAKPMPENDVLDLLKEWKPVDLMAS